MNKHQKDVKNLKKQLEKNMGIDVNFARKNLAVRPEMNATIDRMGKDLCPTGLKYAGSISIFMYLSDSKIHIGGGELATAVNFTGPVPLSLLAVKAMLDNAKIDILNHYMSEFEKKEASSE